nr:hypothetical protein [Endozoicomonas sp.]
MKVFTSAIILLLLAGCDSRFARYDPITVQITPDKSGYSVQTMDCPPIDITPVGSVYEGCAVVNSRFQSMVHPEKMLPEPLPEP